MKRQAEDNPDELKAQIDTLENNKTTEEQA